MRTSAKNCLKCGPQPIEHFGKNARYKDGLHPYCKSCRSEQGKERWQGLTDEQKQRILAQQAAGKRMKQEEVLRYLLDHCCVDCGEDDPVVLEFDHVRGEKLGDVSSLLDRHAFTPTIEAEIAKCDVVCANCHRRRTAQRGNFFRLQAVS